jgi:hypothetical protein
MIFFGEDALRNAVREFLEHYHLERNHQGLGNALIVPIKTTHEITAPSAMPAAVGGTAELLLPRSSIKLREWRATACFRYTNPRPQF